MSGESVVLVVANVTATSRELIDALKDRAAGNPCRFSLILPTKHAPEGGHARGPERLEEALDRMRNAGLTVEGGWVRDLDPVSAVMETLGASKVDELVISTLPSGTSKWMESDVPQRLREQTGLPVQHVIATGSSWETFARPS